MSTKTSEAGRPKASTRPIFASGSRSPKSLASSHVATARRFIARPWGDGPPKVVEVPFSALGCSAASGIRPGGRSSSSWKDSRRPAANLNDPARLPPPSRPPRVPTPAHPRREGILLNVTASKTISSASASERSACTSLSRVRPPPKADIRPGFGASAPALLDDSDSLDRRAAGENVDDAPTDDPVLRPLSSA